VGAKANRVTDQACNKRALNALADCRRYAYATSLSHEKQEDDEEHVRFGIVTSRKRSEKEPCPAGAPFNDFYQRTNAIT
jgi:hypothetical protein